MRDERRECREYLSVRDCRKSEKKLLQGCAAGWSMGTNEDLVGNTPNGYLSPGCSQAPSWIGKLERSDLELELQSVTSQGATIVYLRMFLDNLVGKKRCAVLMLPFYALGNAWKLSSMSILSPSKPAMVGDMPGWNMSFSTCHFRHVLRPSPHRLCSVAKLLTAPCSGLGLRIREESWKTKWKNTSLWDFEAVYLCLSFFILDFFHWIFWSWGCDGFTCLGWYLCWSLAGSVRWPKTLRRYAKRRTSFPDMPKVVLGSE